MTVKPEKNVADVARELGRYPLGAFEFLHEGLSFTVERIHGAEESDLRTLVDWLESQGIDAMELDEHIESQTLPEPLLETIEQFGGAIGVQERMNRHVSGRDLCWGLRDYALQKWGLMAPAVLRTWGIRSTKDFGEMVFALVENGLLQKQPDDAIDDFKNVFDFDTAFDGAYKIGAHEASD